MKKTILVIMISMLAFVGKSYAEMSYGVSLAFTQINADGSETEGGEINNGSADHKVVIPSLFAEYAYSDKVSVGLDYIPLSADVSDKAKSRTDTETSVTGTTTTTSTSRAQSAQAELSNHVTLYSNYMLSDATYVKAGLAFVQLETQESLGTGSNYGNEDIYGAVIGVGAKSGNSRFEIVYTDYEDVSLTSTVARTGVTTNNKIDADLDTLAFKYSYAF
ncbi:hypothetical protein N9M72_01125 [Candidatus Pelagibacter bacterium]|nr:hypothetical protein [Candidatus Pelagibacter bacterium]